MARYPKAIPTGKPGFGLAQKLHFLLYEIGIVDYIAAGSADQMMVMPFGMRPVGEFVTRLVISSVQFAHHAEPGEKLQCSIYCCQAYPGTAAAGGFEYFLRGQMLPSDTERIQHRMPGGSDAPA